MSNLSFKEYLKVVEEKEPEYQDLASRILGIEPEDREKQVYVAADVQDGKRGWNALAMTMGKAVKKDGRVVGNHINLLTRLPGQRTTRRFVKRGDKWADMGREDGQNRELFVPAKVANQWINQGAQGGAGMGGPPGL
jgi:hypothetical protein